MANQSAGVPVTALEALDMQMSKLSCHTAQSNLHMIPAPAIILLQGHERSK